MDEMEKALREELEKHLDTLRRNLEVVPMDVLKTKYKKPYQELKESICKAATAYTRHVSLGGIRIKQKYGDEATSYANEAVKDSQCLKRISEAAFERQDMNEIAALAKQLREEILQVLHVFYLQHMCIYVSKECMSDHHLAPEVYNDATAQVWRNGEWHIAACSYVALLFLFFDYCVNCCKERTAVNQSVRTYSVRSPILASPFLRYVRTHRIT